MISEVGHVLNDGLNVGFEELFLSPLSDACEQDRLEEMRVVLKFSHKLLELEVGSLWRCSPAINEGGIDGCRSLLVGESTILLLPGAHSQRRS